MNAFLFVASLATDNRLSRLGGVNRMDAITTLEGVVNEKPKSGLVPPSVGVRFLV